MKEKKTLYLVISRVCVLWNHPNLNNWDEWHLNRLKLYSNFTRPSLMNQTDQDFKLLSLVDESVNLKDLLPNEVEIKIKSNGNYPQREIINEITNYINSKSNDYDNVIVTRLDSDDMLRYDFIEKIKEKLLKIDTYCDIFNTYHYDIKLGHIYKSPIYQKNISHFVSVKERISNFKCIPYLYEHAYINHYIRGNKHDDLCTIEIIHDNNMINKIHGIIDNNIKLEDFR